MRTDAIKLTQQQQALLRKRAIRLRIEGKSNKEVAQTLSVHPKTVAGWWARYAVVGIALFEPRRRGRRPNEQRRLTVAQEHEVMRLITSGPPEQLELSLVLWTRSAVGVLIERACGIVLADRTLGGYLKRWGYSGVRPQRRARERTDPAMVLWLASTYPTIIKGAGRQGALLFWGDQQEVNRQPASPPAAMSQIEPAKLPNHSTSIAASAMRAVTNRGALRFLVYKGTLNVGFLVRFCRRLVASTEGRGVVLILAHLPVHDDPVFLRWVENHHRQFTVWYVPQ
jgi:transposase